MKMDSSYIDMDTSVNRKAEERFSSLLSLLCTNNS
jgi:hypothetical protein